MRKCFLMRGVPGAGKDHWIRNNVRDPWIVSTDRFFLVQGEYKFDPAKLADYHNQALRLFMEYVAEGYSRVAVSNTNIRMFEIAPYYRIAEAYGYDVEIVHVVADPEKCKLRNTHGVPPATIDQMVRSIEPVPAWWKLRVVLN